MVKACAVVVMAMACTIGVVGASADESLAATPERLVSDDACSAEDDECGLSLRQLRGEVQVAGIQAHVQGEAAGRESHRAAQEEESQPGGAESAGLAGGRDEELQEIGARGSEDCRSLSGICASYMTYGVGADCKADTACRLLDVGAYGGAAGSAWFCAPSDEACAEFLDLEPDQFQPVDELPEEVMDQELAKAAPDADAAAIAAAADAGMHADTAVQGGSCAGRGCHGYVRGAHCQCNSRCHNYGNCCYDYGSRCAEHHGSGSSAHGPVMTLYHTTSVSAAKAILREGFHAGRGGWCGGAIYFIDHPHLPKSKYNPVTTHNGAILQAKVRMGKMATSFSRHCNGYGGHGVSAASHAGYDSLEFNPGDGSEFVIWHGSQVESVKIYEYAH